MPGLLSVDKGDRLEAGDFKALAAAQILAGDHIFLSNHVGARFRPLGAVSLVSAGRKLSLFGSH
jgi:hypothetical protein